jgi:hypothetical protein
MGPSCVSVPPDLEVPIRNTEIVVKSLMQIYQTFPILKKNGEISGPFDSKVFFHEFAKLARDLQERQIAQIRIYPDEPERWIDITGEGDFKAFLDLYAEKLAGSLYMYIVKTRREGDFFARRENSSSVPLLELCKKIILAAMLVYLIQGGDKVRTGGRSLAGPGVGGKDIYDLGLEYLAEMFGKLPLSIPFNARNFGKPPNNGHRGPGRLNLRFGNEPRGYKAAVYNSEAPLPVPLVNPYTFQPRDFAAGLREKKYP